MLDEERGWDACDRLLDDLAKAPLVPEWKIDRHVKHGAGRLTRRQLETVRAISRGLSNKQIALTLGIGEESVKTYVAGVIVRLGAENRAHAVAIALRKGLID
jgi:DNA-binding NarL/FixJ family response regulator